MYNTIAQHKLQKGNFKKRNIYINDILKLSVAESYITGYKSLCKLLEVYNKQKSFWGILVI